MSLPLNPELSTWMRENADDVVLILDHLRRDPVSWAVEIVLAKLPLMITEVFPGEITLRHEDSINPYLKRPRELMRTFLDTGELAVCYRCLSPIVQFANGWTLSLPRGISGGWHRCENVMTTSQGLGAYEQVTEGDPAGSRSEAGDVPGFYPDVDFSDAV